MKNRTDTRKRCHRKNNRLGFIKKGIIIMKQKPTRKKTSVKKRDEELEVYSIMVDFTNQFLTEKGITLKNFVHENRDKHLTFEHSMDLKNNKLVLFLRHKPDDHPVSAYVTVIDSLNLSDYIRDRELFMCELWRCYSIAVVLLDNVYGSRENPIRTNDTPPFQHIRELENDVKHTILSKIN